MSNKTLLLAIICLLIGFTCAYLIFGYPVQQSARFNSKSERPSSSIQNHSQSDVNPSNSFTEDIFNARFENIENNIALMQQQLQEIDFSLNESRPSSTEIRSNSRASTVMPGRQSRYRQRTFTIDRLIKGGIDSATAENIVRRKNAVELKRLELSDRATRENYMNTQRYFDELAEVDQTDVNLREELGDERYDEYLYNSKQTNRIRVVSVMLGSAAERAGLEKNDIILSYDNKRMFTWPDLKQATADGELGEYTSINISRGGEVFSYSVPRGTLGIQMGATRLSP
jgi:C-terminal processing protease CtpA/Prc